MSNVKFVKKEEKKSNLLNYILVAFIVIMGASIFVMLRENSSIKEVSYQEYVEKKKSDDYSVFLLARDGCSHCQLYKPQVNEVARENNLTVYYLDVDNLSEEEFYDIHDNINALKDEYSSDNNAVLPTPTTVIFKNNTEIVSEVGNIGYDGFMNLLKNSGMVK